MYQICISGSSHGKGVVEGKQLAQAAGRALARAGHSLLTGATVGLPNYAAEAYKAAGGIMSVGLSPATSKVEHVLKYHLPLKAYDTIVYTGLHYTGRDSLLVNSADAVICVSGRLGTLHEFTIAMETETPIGFLEGGGGISEQIGGILEAAGKSDHDNSHIVFSSDAEELVAKLVALLNKRRENYMDLYR